MILISHRCNMDGKYPEFENNPIQIDRALKNGYEVEIDVWYKDDEFYLGHDEPTYHINVNWLQNKKLWCHAKNIEALNVMLDYDIHCFWHQEDDVTLTSCGFIWTYPGQKLTDKSICVLPEKNNEIPKKALGICSDCIVNYKHIHTEK